MKNFFKVWLGAIALYFLALYWIVLAVRLRKKKEKQKHKKSFDGES